MRTYIAGFSNWELRDQREKPAVAMKRIIKKSKEKPPNLQTEAEALMSYKKEAESSTTDEVASSSIYLKR